MMEDKWDEQTASNPEDDGPPNADRESQSVHDENSRETGQDLEAAKKPKAASKQQKDQVKRLQALLREANAKNKTLEEELARSKSVLGKLSDELAKKHSEFNAYVSASKEGIMNLGKENEKLRKEIREKAEQVVALESKIMMLSQLGVIGSEDIDTLQDEIMESSAKLRGENEALREALKKADEKSLSDARKLHQLQEQLQAHLEENRKLGTEQKHLQLELEALQNDLAVLEQKYSEMQVVRNQLEKQVTEEDLMHTSLQKARAKVREQKELISGLKTHISDLERKYGTIVHQLESMDEKDEELDKLSRKVDEYRDRIADLEGKYGAAVHQLEMVDEKDKELNQLSEKIDKYRAQIAELKYKEKQATELKQQLIKTQEEFGKVQEEYEHAKVELKRLDKLDSELTEKEQLNKRLREEVTTHKTQVAALTAEIEALEKHKDKLRESQDAVSDLMGRIAGMATKITNLKAELKTIEEKDRKIQEQRDTMIELNERIGVLRAEFETQIKEKDTKIHELQTDIQLKNKEMEALETKTRETEAQLTAMQESIHRTLALDDKLEALGVESTRRTESLEKQLAIFELTADGLSQMKEDLVKEKKLLHEKIQLTDIYATVLRKTDLGKVFLLVRELGQTNVDHVSRALGIPKLNMLPFVRTLAKMGVITFDKKTVAFIAPAVEEPSVDDLVTPTSDQPS